MTDANGSKRDRFKRFFQKLGSQKNNNEDTKSTTGSSTSVPHDHREAEIKDPSSRLWLKAYQGLRNDESELVETYEKLLTEETKDVSDGISQIASSAANCFIDCTQQQLVGQMRFAAEKSIKKARKHAKTRDGVVQAVEFVDSISKACGSLLQMFPPAAMACSGICIILPLLIQPFKADNAMITGLDYVISRMEWYMNLYQLVFQNDSDGKSKFASVRKSMEESTIKLYQSLMKYEIQCALYCFRDHPIVKVTKAILDPENWKNRLQDIKDLETTIIGDMSRCSSQETIEYLKETSINIVNIEKYLQQRKDQDDLDRIECAAKERQAKEQNQHELTGLFNTTAYKKRMDFNRKRVPGTCQWFQTHPEFERWLIGQGGLLLVSADPGCGKSVLATYLIETVLPEKDPKATISYFFFKDNPEQRDFANCSCAILHRLFFENSFLAEYCQDLILKYGSTLKSDSTALWEVFEKAVSHPDAGQVICVFDGLDECDPEGFRELLQTLGRFLQSQSSASATENRKVKFLMTTRGYPEILDAFKDLGPAYLHLCGDSTTAKTQIQKEINLVVDFRLAELSRKKGLSPDRQKLIRDSLMQRAGDYEQRTYLWVYLLFEVLQRNFNNTADKWTQLIDNPPDTVNKAYEELLSRVRPDEIELVRVLFRLTISAVRPLTLKEMNLAVHARSHIGMYSETPLDLPPEDDFRKLLISACGFFLTVYDDKIFFIHQTAKEFLLRDDKDIAEQRTSSRWYKSITNFQAHRSMAESSVAVLSNKELSTRTLSEWASSSQQANFIPASDIFKYDRGPYRVYDDSFLSYILDYWLWHFESAQEFDGELLLHDIDSTFLPSYFSLFDGNPALSRPWLFLTIVQNTKMKPIAELASYFCLSWQAANMELCHHVTVVDIAAYYGQYRLLKYCTENKGFGWDCLISLEDREKFCTRVSVKDTTLPERRIRPVFFATLSGSRQCLEYIIQLSQGAVVNARNHKNRTPLHIAVRSRHFELMKLLIDQGADVNAEDFNGCSALEYFHILSFQRLSKNYEEDMDAMRFIISKGANLHWKNRDGKTIVHCALLYIPEIFLEFEALNREYQLRKGNFYKRKVFVEHEKDTGNEEGLEIEESHPAVELNLSSEAAFISAYNRSFIKLLVDHGVNLNAKSSDWQTPLYMACDNAKHWACAVLLHSGADVDLTDDRGHSPLHVACERGNTVVIRLLLKYGARVTATSFAGDTPLHSVCERIYGDTYWIICELLARGVEVNLHGFRGETALHRLCQNGGRISLTKCAMLLLDNGAEVNSRDDEGKTPLHFACRGSKCESTVILLVNRGADIKARDKYGVTPLHFACRRLNDESNKIIQLLLRNGSEVNAQDEKGRTPLHFASEEEYCIGALQLLLKNGLDVNAQDKQGRTPLHVTCELGNNIGIVTWLLDNGAEVNARDRYGDTPLHKACGKRWYGLNILDLLLDRGAEVDARDNFGATPLHIACQQRCELSILELLLDRGAKIDAQNSYGATPLHKACGMWTWCYMDALKLLIDRGANINARDNDGATPLHSVCMWTSEISTIQWLLDNGADVNARDIEGTTPLGVVQKGYDKSAINVLLENGAEE